MSNKALTLVLKTIVFIIFYSIHFFVLSTISAIYDIPTTLMTYILPILIILFLSFITQKTYSISCQLYAYIYYISTAYLGLILNMYMFILLYKSLSFFIPFTRCASVIIAIISPISVSLYGLINARIITTEEVTIKTALVSSKVTIALLSDLHLGAVYQGGFTNSIVNIIIKEINPDVVLITGDLFDNNFTPRSEWLKPFSKIKAPILYVTGNHEEIIGKEEIVKIISTTKMKQLRNGKFTYHFLPINKPYREYITKSLACDEFSRGKYAKEIYQHNILLLDDSISRGQTIKNACDILNSFQPKSITVLTMFSKRK